MIKYDILGARRVNLSNIKIDQISLFVNYSYELCIIMTRYDFLYA